MIYFDHSALILAVIKNISYVWRIYTWQYYIWMFLTTLFIFCFHGTFHVLKWQGLEIDLKRGIFAFNLASSQYKKYELFIKIRRALKSYNIYVSSSQNILQKMDSFLHTIACSLAIHMHTTYSVS